MKIVRSVAVVAVLAAGGMAFAASPAVAGRDTTPPTQPTDLRAGTVTTTSVGLSWSPATDNSGQVEYLVYRLTSSSRTWAGIRTTASSATVTGLSSGTGYSFAVLARDAAGNTSRDSAPVSVTTDRASTTPAAPASLRTTGVTATSVALAWDAPATDAFVVYGISVNGSATGLRSWTPTYTVSGLTPGSGYTFAVWAEDGSGNRSELSSAVSAATTADTAAPSSPTGLSADFVYADGTAQLRWQAAADSGGGTLEYALYSGTTRVTNWGTRTEYWFICELPPGTHQFTVRARDAAANLSSPSNVVDVVI